ncbi:hypothetical protein AwDysgo_08470 [Bacteroidales bacterium]|nr:hypothetical protein AwDysgo_08470 [Bacteroidales bacterium]
MCNLAYSTKIGFFFAITSFEILNYRDLVELLNLHKTCIYLSRFWLAGSELRLYYAKSVLPFGWSIEV